jgi:hypothetical protein
MQQSIYRPNQQKSNNQIPGTHTLHKKQWPTISLCTSHFTKRTRIWSPQRYHDATQTNPQIIHANSLRTITNPNLPSKRDPHPRTKLQWTKPTISVSHGTQLYITTSPQWYYTIRKNQPWPSHAGFLHNYLNSTDQYIPQDSLTPVLIRPRWKEVAVPVCE